MSNRNYVARFTVPLIPVTKKNNNRIGYRITKDKYGNSRKTPFILPSENYAKYEKDAMWFMPKIDTIDYPVNVKCLFYMPTRRRVDLTNLLECIDDVMVKYGVIKDDAFTIIESHDGSRVMHDKENPRTEVYIWRA